MSQKIKTIHEPMLFCLKIHGEFVSGLHLLSHYFSRRGHIGLDWAKVLSLLMFANQGRESFEGERKKESFRVQNGFWRKMEFWHGMKLALSCYVRVYVTFNDKKSDEGCCNALIYFLLLLSFMVKQSSTELLPYTWPS